MICPRNVGTTVFFQDKSAYCGSNVSLLGGITVYIPCLQYMLVRYFFGDQNKLYSVTTAILSSTSIVLVWSKHEH